MMKMMPRIEDGVSEMEDPRLGGSAPLNATWPLGGLSVPAD